MKCKKLNIVCLGDVVSIASGGTPNKGNDRYWNGNIPWISAKEMHGDFISSSSLKITDLGLEAGSCLAPAGSILLLTRGSGLFKSIPLCWTQCDVAFNQDVKCLTSKNADVSNDYLFYALKGLEHHISGLIETTGIGAGKISTDRLLSLQVPMFQHEYRAQITQFADVLFRKKQLNNQINDYLAALLDIQFEQILTDADIEWEQASLLDIADYKNGLAMQKFRPEGLDKGLPVLKIRELGQGYCGKDTERCRSDLDESVVIHDGDLVFSWSGTLLLDFWAAGDAGLNQHLFKVTSKDYPSWFYYMWTKRHLRRFISMAKDRATTMGHIKRSALQESKVLIPPGDKLTEFTTVMQPMVDEMIGLKVQGQKLGELRDTLLPKLMSGEIDVSRVDITPLNNHLVKINLRKKL